MKLTNLYIIPIYFIISIYCSQGLEVTNTFAMIKPDGFSYSKRALVFNNIQLNNLTIVRQQIIWLNRQQASEFYEEHKDRPFFNNLVNYITSGPVTALELQGVDAVKKWREIIGPTDPKKAKLSAPVSLRARKGTDLTRNLVHGSDSETSAKREIGFMFSSQLRTLPIEFSLNPKVNNDKTIVLIQGSKAHQRQFIDNLNFCTFKILSKKYIHHDDQTINSYFKFQHNTNVNINNYTTLVVEIGSDEGIIPLMITYLFFMDKPLAFRYYTSINNVRYQQDLNQFFQEPMNEEKCTQSCERGGKFISFLKSFI